MSWSVSGFAFWRVLESDGAGWRAMGLQGYYARALALMMSAEAKAFSCGVWCCPLRERGGGPRPCRARASLPPPALLTRTAAQ